MILDSAGVVQKANPRARELLRLKDANQRAGLADFLTGPPIDQMKSLWLHPISFARPPLSTRHSSLVSRYGFRFDRSCLALNTCSCAWKKALSFNARMRRRIT